MPNPTTVNPDRDIVLSDVARERLTGLLNLHGDALQIAYTDGDAAVDLDQFVKALKFRDIADRAWMRFHAYAAGVAGVPRADEVAAVTRIRRQLEARS